MSQQMYSQCVLHLPQADGSIKVHTSFIPSQLAKKGKKVKIKWENGIWINGWIVAEVGTAWPEDRCLAYERDHMSQRKASDIQACH